VTDAILTLWAAANVLWLAALVVALWRRRGR
jgi:hypothetical protein